MTASSSPAVAHEYMWFGEQPVAQIGTTGAVHYYFNDHLGIPVLTTDSSGAVDWRVEHEAFGQKYVVRFGASRHQPLSFPGQEDDGSSELSYNIFRWYRSGWGRYSQADPMWSPHRIDELGAYGYAAEYRRQGGDIRVK